MKNISSAIKNPATFCAVCAFSWLFFFLCNLCNLWIISLPHPPQHHGRDYESNHDDCAADENATHTLCGPRPQVTAGRRGYRHPKSAGPGDHVSNREAEYCDPVDADAQKVFDP